MSKRCKRTTFKYTVTSVSPRVHQTEPLRLPIPRKMGGQGPLNKGPDHPIHTCAGQPVGARRGRVRRGSAQMASWNGVVRSGVLITVWPTLRQCVGSVRRTCGAWGMAQRFRNNCPSVEWKLRQKTSSLPWSQTSGASMYFVDKLQNNAITWHHARGAGR